MVSDAAEFLSAILQFKSSSVKSEVPGTPYKKRGTKWNFVPRALRRLLPDLRAKLACSARSDNALRSGAMLAHEENSNVPLILFGVPGTSAVLAMPG